MVDASDADIETVEKRFIPVNNFEKNQSSDSSNIIENESCVPEVTTSAEPDVNNFTLLEATVSTDDKIFKCAINGVSKAEDYYLANLPSAIDNQNVNNEILTDPVIVNKENEVIGSEVEINLIECDKDKEDNKEHVFTSTYCFNEFIELSKLTKLFSAKQFLVACKWSPDGSCLLTSCADYRMRLFDLPQELYNKRSWTRHSVFSELQPSLQVVEGGKIFDCDWYPYMSSWSPDTCCFVTTSSKSPVHLWDAYSGEIRATYCGYNRLDEPQCAISLKFSLNGEKLYCGYKSEIKIFDTNIPGRQCESIDTKHVAEQTGLISCIAENPTVRQMFAAGSYKRTIGLFLDSGDNICLLKGQQGGVTHLIWSNEGTYLYSGGRKDREILCWDIRNLGDVVYTMERTVDTNQRIYFDLTSDGKYLISGSTSGETLIWDLHKVTETTDKKVCDFKFQSHCDCNNGVSVHKQLPILATSSGQYHVPDLTSDDEDTNFFDVNKMLAKIENSVKLWWVGPLND